jgi:hypothetical protein
MGTTGLIYVAIVAAWAAYLVPMWLRRHDETRRLKTVEQYSEAMRVLTRSDERDRYVAVSKPRTVAPVPKRSVAVIRARRVAAMRRRRVFSMLFLSLLSVGALAFFALVPRWVVSVPAGLLVVFLVSARLAVRRRQRLDHHAAVDHRRLRKASRVAVSHSAPAPRMEPAAPEPATEAADGLWDPVPVTLPTYVYKDKAPRTVRTVDLSEPDVFSSAPAAVPDADADGPVEAPPESDSDSDDHVARAVGD